MDRPQILEVVVRHFRANVDRGDAIELDPSKSMLDQGASSLDVVEIVSASMRELRIRVPRTELAGCKNVDDLVDLLERKSAGGI